MLNLSTNSLPTYLPTNLPPYCIHYLSTYGTYLAPYQYSQHHYLITHHHTAYSSFAYIPPYCIPHQTVLYPSSFTYLPPYCISHLHCNCIESLIFYLPTTILHPSSTTYLPTPILYPSSIYLAVTIAI